MDLALLCITIVDWVQMITQSILTIATIILAYYTYKTYLKTPLQTSTTEKTEAGKELSSDLIVFDTSKQRTRLSFDSTNNKIDCYLLNKKDNQESHQWSIQKEEADGIIERSTVYINPNYKFAAGTFTIGKKINWLYSKNLFPEPDYLRKAIFDLINRLI